MESTAREGQAHQREAGVSSKVGMVDHRRTRPTPRAARKLRGCAREGCLEVAKLGSDHCPLHG
jgi:hypothetical protein